MCSRVFDSSGQSLSKAVAWTDYFWNYITSSLYSVHLNAAFLTTGSAISLVVSLVSTCSFGTETAPLLFSDSTESFVTFSILPSIETTAAVTSFISSEVVLAF